MCVRFTRTSRVWIISVRRYNMCVFNIPKLLTCAQDTISSRALILFMHIIDLHSLVILFSTAQPSRQGSTTTFKFYRLGPPNTSVENNLLCVYIYIITYLSGIIIIWTPIEEKCRQIKSCHKIFTTTHYISYPSIIASAQFVNSPIIPSVLYVGIIKG